MGETNLKHYRDVLEHVVRPEDPTDRRDSDRARLDDHEALYLYDGLVEYAAYGSPTKEAEEIALAYAEYIDDVVRNEKKNFVYLYAHTNTAKQVLRAAAGSRSTYVKDLQADVVEAVRFDE